MSLSLNHSKHFRNLIIRFRNVIVGRSYEIVVDIFDAENNAIFPSDNVVVELKVDSNKFAVRHKTDNGTYHLGTPLKAGVAKVSATLVGVVDVETNAVVELKQQLHATG